MISDHDRDMAMIGRPLTMHGADESSSARPASSAPPVRALRLTLALEADTADDMAHALIALAGRIQRDEVTTGCWGSPSDGAIYELLIDPFMTHDAYHKALREYLDSLDAASNDKAKGPARSDGPVEADRPERT